MSSSAITGDPSSDFYGMYASFVVALLMANHWILGYLFLAKPTKGNYPAIATPAMTTRNVNWACWEMLEYYLILFEYTIFVMVWPTKVCDIVAKLRQAVEETRDKPVVSINGSHFLYTTQAGPMPGPPVDPVLPLPSGRHRPGSCQQGQC